MASFMGVLQTARQSQNSSSYTITYTGSLFHATSSCWGILAATKEIQHVIDTINDGTLYLQGACTSTLRGKGTKWQIRC